MKVNTLRVFTQVYKKLNIKYMTNIMTLKVSTRFVIAASLMTTALAIAVLPSITSADTLYRQLQLGMSGNDVSSLQSFLAKDATIYPQGLVTGYFGSLTKSGVMKFQVRNGIPAVGRVGPQTLPVINAQMGGLVTGNDQRSPTISGVNLNVSATTATAAWNTDENSSALLYYSTSPLALTEGSETTAITVYGTSVIANINLQSMHGATVTGLQANTTYYYLVYARDSAGNESITWPSTFRTSN
jgi:peptidoglycan hydrolase-like protein with peptidoglycan-binding domain